MKMGGRKARKRKKADEKDDGTDSGDSESSPTSDDQKEDLEMDLDKYITPYRVTDYTRRYPEDSNGVNISTSTSSFEALDPHDPNLSRLATTLFQKTSDYLSGELTATQEHYILLEEINRLAVTKYADLRHIAANLGKTVNEYNDMFNTSIKPLLSQIDVMEEQVSRFESSAYKLDSYTKQLKQRFKELEDK